MTEKYVLVAVRLPGPPLQCACGKWARLFNSEIGIVCADCLRSRLIAPYVERVKQYGLKKYTGHDYRWLNLPKPA